MPTLQELTSFRDALAARDGPRHPVLGRTSCTRARIRAVLLLTLLAAVGYAAWTHLRPRPDSAAARARTDRNRAALLARGTYDAFGHREKRSARLGECGMNGANSLDEADRQPLYFCPVCLRKLQHCFGFDLEARYAELEAFYREHGLLEDAAWVVAQRAHLGERGRPPWGQE